MNLSRAKQRKLLKKNPIIPNVEVKVEEKPFKREEKSSKKSKIKSED